MFLRLTWCLCLLLATGAACADDAGLTERAMSILSSRCARCHGSKQRKAELDLTTATGIRKGSESGPVVVPGRASESRLFEVLHEGEMPPDGKSEPTAEEVDIVRRWIDGGARLPDGKTSMSGTPTDHDIVPLLHLRCTVCHGLRRREGELDLRTRESLLRGGRSGPGIVLGKPEQSLILKRIHAGEMPPRREVVAVSIKPMEDNEIAQLTEWIRAGAPESNAGPDVATEEPDLLVSDSDREFWAFRRPVAVAPPPVGRSVPTRHPIDAFVVRRLADHHLTPSPEASRTTLLRRLSFDLIGLPPDPNDIASIENDLAPDAFERRIDRLLASPHYGIRWGRHWLDLAGYADSEGVQDSDKLRPHAWRYRDYVIRALNTGKSYRQFLLEQIAGDELFDFAAADATTDEMYDSMAATAFLRMAIDGTFANITNYVPDRLETIAREMEVLTSSVMGLSMKCARCHTHKFDPIPQRDYYRLLAVFKGAFDEHDWLKPERQAGKTPGDIDRYQPHVSQRERRQWQRQNAAIDRQAAALKQLPETEDTKKQIAQLEASRPAEPLVRALWDRGEPSPTFLLKRGNYLTPGRLVGPGVPSVLTDGRTPFRYQPPFPGAKSTGRRLAFARWLTADNQPLTARVMVNRIWKHHFGQGIVTSLDNFGRAGVRPSHPDLLDWLAVEFGRRDWDIKAMHRVMLSSATWRQSSHITNAAVTADPDNRLLSRMPVVRLEAEVLRDSLLFVAGQLDPRLSGPADPVEVRPDGLVTSSRGKRGWRRSVYILQRRTQVPTLLENFDLPAMAPNCIERGQSTVAPQSLLLLNNAFVHSLAESLADRVTTFGSDPQRRIERAWQLAIGREPNDDEASALRDSFHELDRVWKASAADDKSTTSRPLVNICRAILNSSAFLYVD